MVESKYELLKDIELVLHTTFSETELIEHAITQITLRMENYEVSSMCTDLARYSDEDEKILKRYLACLLVEGKSPGTIEGYRYRLQHMINHSQIHFTDMRAYDIRFYLANLKQQGYSDRTLESVRQYISAFFTWMINEGIISKNPMLQIKPIKYKEEMKEAFSDLDIEKIRRNCKNDRERALVEFLLSSGVRAAELSQMNVDDLNFQDNSVHVKFGKGNKERITYMSPLAAYYINKYLNQRDDKDIALFTSIKGKERLKPGGIRHILKQIEDRADITNVHPHRFRRTFATMLSNKGMAVQVIQYLMGHSNLDTTMVYINLDNRNIRSEYLKYIQ